jgi:hypothetical protein
MQRLPQRFEEASDWLWRRIDRWEADQPEWRDPDDLGKPLGLRNRLYWRLFLGLDRVEVKVAQLVS